MPSAKNRLAAKERPRTCSRPDMARSDSISSTALKSRTSKVPCSGIPAHSARPAQLARGAQVSIKAPVTAHPCEKGLTVRESRLLPDLQTQMEGWLPGGALHPRYCGP